LAVRTALSPALANAPVLDAAFVKTFINQFLATAWKTPSSTIASPPKKHVVVLAGPCGSGKSTIARQLSATFTAPFVEGDELHTRDAVLQMAAGTPLDDDIRAPWFDRLKQRALASVTELGYDNVFVACSALKQAYRDRFRELEKENEGVKVLFVDLQVEQEELVRRMRERGGHYMKESMVEGQVAMKEEPGLSETDVLPVDAGKAVQEVAEEVRALLGMAGVV
jgi:carbohydrate kinase (thermoresistant glucokinase family)